MTISAVVCQIEPSTSKNTSLRHPYICDRQLLKKSPGFFLFLPMTCVIVRLTVTLFWFTRFQHFHSLGRAHLEEIMAGHQVTSCSRHFNKRSEFGKTGLMKKRSKCRTSQSTASSRKLLRSLYFNVKSSDTEKKTLRVQYI